MFLGPSCSGTLTRTSMGGVVWLMVPSHGRNPCVAVAELRHVPYCTAGLAAGISL